MAFGVLLVFRCHGVYPWVTIGVPYREKLQDIAAIRDGQR